MAGLTLRALLSPRSASFAVITAYCQASGAGLSVVDGANRTLVGDNPPHKSDSDAQISIELDGANLGSVIGPRAWAEPLAQLIHHLAERESERRALASETLHLYRELNLIEQLSEHLAAVLDLAAVSESALAQAQRLIPATHGSVMLIDKASGALSTVGSFGDSIDADSKHAPLAPDSPLAASVLERGVGEIVNDCAADPRIRSTEAAFSAVLCSPLRTGQRTAGLIALASTQPGAGYSAANLKLLNTIALQTAAAIENAMLCAEMVESAREHAAIASELQAASSVQQLLLQNASDSTPGFRVESVYLPASQAGGDFYFVHPASDGALIAIVGDVSGKGLTAAMRVALILGVLRRESSHDPATILFHLNNALAVHGQLGFATACCLRILPTGNFEFANAGHIPPFVSGRELETIPSLPLGLLPDQKFEIARGQMQPGHRMVLLSDGVVEAKSSTGELLGFDRLPALTLGSAREIAEAAQRFGQDDDITVLTLDLLAHG